MTDAQPMWEAHDAGRLHAYLPASVLTDIFYIRRKQVGVERARQAIEACLRGFIIVAVDRPLIASAVALPGGDFEDNVQIACAQSAGLNFIVTRNIIDFAHSPVTVVEPTAVVNHLPPTTDRS